MFQSWSATSAGYGSCAHSSRFERLAYRCHVALVERVLAETWCVPGCEQQMVAVAQGDVEALGQVQHHLVARARTDVLDEAEMPGRHAERGHVELGEMAPLSPLPKQRSCG
jgi:hypothetical protein